MASHGKYKVFVSRADIPPKAMELLETKCDVTSVACTPTNWLEIWSKHVAGMEALFIQHYEQINVKTLDMAGTHLRVVSTMSAHYGNIDLEECRRRGSWTPTTDLTWLTGRELVGKVAGIVGLGNIGIEIVNRLRAFKMRSILYHNRRPKMEPLPFDTQYTTLKHLLCNSDIVIVSCPLNLESYQMFNEKTFHLMKHSAIFVSISRREVVDEEALCNALKNGGIGFAALDAAGDTPMDKDNPLLKLPNCVVTPHLAAHARDAVIKSAVMCTENILAVLEEKYYAAANLLC
nr:glyoxylate reductase/hydroxypyruvate reductase-like [Rhipicephalus microplus]